VAAELQALMQKQHEQRLSVVRRRRLVAATAQKQIKRGVDAKGKQAKVLRKRD